MDDLTDEQKDFVLKILTEEIESTDLLIVVDRLQQLKLIVSWLHGYYEDIISELDITDERHKALLKDARDLYDIVVAF